MELYIEEKPEQLKNLKSLTYDRYLQELQNF